METLQNLLNHRSIRKFQNKPVPDAMLNKILEAAMRSATTGNMQLYSIIVTTNEENRKEIWEYHFKQNMILQAPVVLTFCADFNRFNTWCRQREAVPGYDNFLSFYTASIDALLAAQNAVVAAEDFGLGTCYLGTTTYMAHKFVDFFNLPEGVVPVTTVVMGFPDETPPLTDRLPLKGVVHYEKYKPYQQNDIDEIYREKEALSETKQLLIENDLETLAQIFTQKRYSHKDNLTFSKLFLDVINNQGFMNNEE